MPTKGNLSMKNIDSDISFDSLDFFITTARKLELYDQTVIGQKRSIHERKIHEFTFYRFTSDSHIVIIETTALCNNTPRVNEPLIKNRRDIRQIISYVSCTRITTESNFAFSKFVTLHPN